MKFILLIVALLFISSSFCAVQKRETKGHENNNRYSFKFDFTGGFTAEGEVLLKGTYKPSFIDSTLSSSPTFTTAATTYIVELSLEVRNKTGFLVQRGFSVKDGLSYDPQLYFSGTVSTNGDSITVTRLDINTLISEGNANAAQTPYYRIANDVNNAGTIITPTTTFQLLSYKGTTATSVDSGTTYDIHRD